MKMTVDNDKRAGVVIYIHNRIGVYCFRSRVGDRIKVTHPKDTRIKKYIFSIDLLFDVYDFERHSIFIILLQYVSHHFYFSTHWDGVVMNNQIFQIGIRPVVVNHHKIGLAFRDKGKAAVAHVLFKVGRGNAAHHAGDGVLGETPNKHRQQKC